MELREERLPEGGTAFVISVANPDIGLIEGAIVEYIKPTIIFDEWITSWDQGFAFPMGDLKILVRHVYIYNPEEYHFELSSNETRTDEDIDRVRKWVTGLHRRLLALGTEQD